MKDAPRKLVEPVFSMDPELQRERYSEAIRGGRLYRILANDPRYRPLDKYVTDIISIDQGIFR